MLDEMDDTCREDNTISIDACSLSNSDGQVDTALYGNQDSLSKVTRSLSGSGEQMDTTTNKEDGITSHKDDDVTSIGVCSLSDTDEQIAEKHSVVKDDLENSNGMLIEFSRSKTIHCVLPKSYHKNNDSSC